MVDGAYLQVAELEVHFTRSITDSGNAKIDYPENFAGCHGFIVVRILRLVPELFVGTDEMLRQDSVVNDRGGPAAGPSENGRRLRREGGPERCSCFRLGRPANSGGMVPVRWF